MLHAVVVRPVRLKQPDTELRTWRLRGIGYAWKCSCGESGPIRTTYHVARFEGRVHMNAHRAPT